MGSTTGSNTLHLVPGILVVKLRLDIVQPLRSTVGHESVVVVGKLPARFAVSLSARLVSHDITIAVGEVRCHLAFHVQRFFEIAVVGPEDDDFGTRLVGTSRTHVIHQVLAAQRHTACHRRFDGGCLFLRRQVEQFVGRLLHYLRHSGLGLFHKCVELSLCRTLQRHIAAVVQQNGHLQYDLVRLAADVATLQQHHFRVVRKGSRHFRQTSDECRTCRRIGKLAQRRRRQVRCHADSHLIRRRLLPCHLRRCRVTTVVVVVVAVVAAARYQRHHYAANQHSGRHP